MGICQASSYRLRFKPVHPLSAKRRRSEAARVTTQMSRSSFMIHFGDTRFPPKWVQIEELLRWKRPLPQAMPGQRLPSSLTPQLARQEFV